ncbi:MAG TPA: PAS domain-containing protein, partial [Actinopolymorphaceae bacterium]
MSVQISHIETGLEMFDAAPAGIAVTSGPDHVVIYTNPAYRAIFGERPVGVPIGQSAASAVEIDRFLSYFDYVLTTGEPVTSGDQPLRATYATGGTLVTKWTAVSYSPITVAGHPPGVLVVAADVTERVLQQERIARLAEDRRRITARYRTLGRVGSQMVMVTDPDGAVTEPSPGWEAVTGQRFEEFRGDGWALAIHPDDREAMVSSWRHAVETRPEYWEHDFRLLTVDAGYRHFRVRSVPVYDEGEVVEWVGICTDIEEEHQEARREQILDRAAATTSGLVDIREMLEALARVIVPALADTCRVYVPRAPTHRTQETIDVERAAAVVRPGIRALPPERISTYGPETMLGRAVRERHPSFSIFPQGAPPPGVAPEWVMEWLRKINANSLVVLPIIVDGTVAAAAAITVCDVRPPPGEADLRLITDAFDHAHDALSSAIAFRQHQMIASAMQHILLTEPPTVEGVDIAARYTPTTSGAEVGGDWYDCFHLPGDVLMVSIGDVAGHDLPAAVTMSQVRTILRGLAVENHHTCGDILHRLNTAMGTLYADSTATCVLARLVATSGEYRLSYAIAGHPPPLVVTPDGEGRFLEAGHN